jgi:hypothetical protein
MEAVGLVSLMIVIVAGAIRAIRADSYWTRARVTRQLLAIAAHVAIVIALSVLAARAGGPGNEAVVLPLVGALLVYIVISTVWLARKLRPRSRRAGL